MNHAVSTMCILALVTTLAACTSGGPPREDSSPVRDADATNMASYDVAFPKNDAACTSDSRDAVVRWVQHAQSWNYAITTSWQGRSARATLAAHDGPVLLEPPDRVVFVDGHAVYLDGKKLADTTPSPWGVVSEKSGPTVTRASQGYEELGGDTHVVGIDAKLPAQYVFGVLRQMPLNPDRSLRLLARIPQDRLRVEPIPEKLRARFVESLGLAPGMPRTQERVAVVSDHVMGEFSRIAASCPELHTVDQTRERMSYEEFRAHVGERLGGTWVACGCDFDLEYLLAAFHGQHLWAQPTLLTELSVTIDEEAKEPISIEALGARAWKEVMDELKPNQAICLTDVPESWCERPRASMLCASACPPHFVP